MANSERLNSYNDSLNSANQEIANYQEQYKLIAKQMEDLMQRNLISPIPNYEEELNKLKNKRDELNQRFAIVNSIKKSYEFSVNEEKEQDHKNRIAQIEKLLNFHITPTDEFIYDQNLGFPRQVLKDSNTLSKEQGAINKQLEQIYYDGDLDLKTYNAMKLAIANEYKGLISKAPRPNEIDKEKMISGQQQSPTSFDDKRKQLEEEKKQIQKQYWEQKLQELGLNNDDINLDSVLRDQELNEEQFRQLVEEYENSHGMSM